jgi:hypothetical protein
MSAGDSARRVRGRGLHSLLLYVPVGFVPEEVSFQWPRRPTPAPTRRSPWLADRYVCRRSLDRVADSDRSQPFGDLAVSLLVIHISIGIRPS